MDYDCWDAAIAIIVFLAAAWNYRKPPDTEHSNGRMSNDHKPLDGDPTQEAR